MNEPPKPAKKTQKAPLGIKRRHVLVGAGVAAGGLAVTRVLGLHHLGPELPTIALPGQATPTPKTKDWIAPLDKPEAQVAHLLRRATFGATTAEYDAAVSDGFKTTVDRLIETPAAEPPVMQAAEDAMAIGRAAKDAGASQQMSPRPAGRYAEYRLFDPVGSQIDISEHGWDV